MKRKFSIITLIIFILLVGGLYLIYFRPFNNGFLKSSPSLTDTIKSNLFCKKAEALKGSKPDSAAFYYNKALHLVLPHSGKKEIDHLSGKYYIGLASLNYNLGNYAQTKHFDSLAVHQTKKYNDLDIEAQALNLEGMVYFNKGDYNNALLSYHLSEQKAQQAGSSRVLAKIWTNRAAINYLQGKLQIAVADFHRTLYYAIKSKDMELLSGTYMNLGLIYSNSGDLKNALINYSKSLLMYQKMHDNDDVQLCLQNIANLYLDRSDYAHAIETYLKALALSEQLNDKAAIARERNNLGEVYARLGEYEKAVTEYMKSAKIKEKLGDKEGLTSLYVGLGSLNYQYKNYDKAYSYYKKALETNESLKIIKGEATGYANMADVSAAKKQYNEAITLYLKSVDSFLKIDYISGLSDTYLSLANTYRDVEKYDLAQLYYDKCIAIKSKLNDKQGTTTVYYELANMNILQAKKQKNSNKYRTALTYALKAEKQSRELKAMPVLANTTSVLKQIYQGLGESSKALNYANEFITLNDSLFNQRQTQALAFAEAKWNSEKKQQEIDQLTRQKKLDQEIIAQKIHESRLQKLIIFAVIFILLLAITVAITTILYLRKRKDTQIQKQMMSMTKLRMQNAKNSLSPHFLFNVLNSVTRNANDPEQVKKKIQDISFLLRQTLENVDKTTISIEEELNLVRKFIELQRDRIPGRLKVNIDIDPDCNLKQPMPAMLIQIPVENSIKHGLMPLPEDAEKLLEIKVMKSNDFTTIEIADNGIGLNQKNVENKGTGTGLKVLMQTVRMLNAKNKNSISYQLTERVTDSGEKYGTLTKIKLPKVFDFEQLI